MRPVRQVADLPDPFCCRVLLRLWPVPRRPPTKPQSADRSLQMCKTHVEHRNVKKPRRTNGQTLFGVYPRLGIRAHRGTRLGAIRNNPGGHSAGTKYLSHRSTQIHTDEVKVCIAYLCESVFICGSFLPTSRGQGHAHPIVYGGSVCTGRWRARHGSGGIQR
jgi:hypothetical protein